MMILHYHCVSSFYKDRGGENLFTNSKSGLRDSAALGGKVLYSSGNILTSNLARTSRKDDWLFRICTVRIVQPTDMTSL